MQMCQYLHSDALPLQGIQTSAKSRCSIRTIHRSSSGSGSSRGRSSRSRGRSGWEHWHIVVRVSTHHGVEVNLPVSATRTVGGDSFNRMTSPIILPGRIEFIDHLNGNFQGIRRECCTKGRTCYVGLEHGLLAVCGQEEHVVHHAACSGLTNGTSTVWMLPSSSETGIFVFIPLISGISCGVSACTHIQLNPSIYVQF